MVGSAALTLAVGLVTALGSGTAFATKHKGSIPTGTVSCTSITGTVTFKPPLTLTGTSPETASSKTTFSGCTASNKSVTVTGGTSKAPVAVSSNSCTGLEGGGSSTAAISFDIAWSPKTAGKTVISFSGDTETNSSSGDAGFNLTGGTAVGSFAETNKATGVAYTNETETALGAACSSSKGLASITIASGTLNA